MTAAPRSDSPVAETEHESATRSTTTSDHKLTEAEKRKIDELFKQLDEKKMWRLSTGTLVERKMEALALKSLYEHPCHSLILDPDDKTWSEYFTNDEIREIKSFNAPQVAPLPAALEEYLDKYAGLTTLDKIREVNKKHDIHPILDPELDWASASIEQALRIMFHQYLQKRRTEADLLKHVWSIIDTCYFFGEIDAISGESSSKATSKRTNNDRTLATVDRCTRKRMGSKIDIMFATEIFEVGTAEAGKVTNPENTKTLYESGFKTPKVLKDMFMDLLREAPGCIRTIKTCGYTISGISLMAHIMDAPAEYVCRMNRMQKWFHYPTSADNFVVRIKALLTVIYTMKGVMERTLQDIEVVSVPSFGFPECEVTIPPCFTPSPKASKKRKISTSTDSANSGEK
ncbi:hypothetical protein BJV82DRAFT_280436 [Fennellomyces sp. T-0311]|nr:hypothetical protein BJV82DRAFT_280436 [Fennellomyces sp. T-0311]